MVCEPSDSQPNKGTEAVGSRVQKFGPKGIGPPKTKVRDVVCGWHLKRPHKFEDDSCIEMGSHKALNF